MNITFRRVKQSPDSAGKLTFRRYGKKPIIINGTYKTTDKEEVEDLLNSDLMRRNDVKLETPMEHVEKYLNGEEPDKLTEDVLKNISAEGLKELAKVLKIPERQHEWQPSVIKVMIRNEPVTNQVQEVLDQYKGEDGDGVEDLLQESMDAGLIYKHGPWYKYRIGEEKDTDTDKNITKNKKEAQLWCEKNREELKNRLD